MNKKILAFVQLMFLKMGERQNKELEKYII